MRFFLKCNESTKVCDKRQYEEASFWDNFRMRMHILVCKFCREYNTNNTKLTKSIKSADIKTFPHNKKEVLRDQINHEINTTQKP